MATVRITDASVADRLNGKPQRLGKVTDRVRVGPDGRILRSDRELVSSSGAGTPVPGLQQLTPLLPTGLVNPGDSWHRTFTQSLRGAEGSVQVDAKGTLVQYDTVDRSTTAIVTNQTHASLSYRQKASKVLGGSAKGGKDAQLELSGHDSNFQTAWIDPVSGTLIESSALDDLDMVIRITGPRGASQEVRVKGTMTLELVRLPSSGTLGSSEDVARDALRRALAAADLHYAAGQTYAGFTPGQASSIAPSLQWRGGADAVKGWITIRRATKTAVLLVTESAKGTLLCIARTPFGTTYGKVNPSRARGCRGGW